MPQSAKAILHQALELPSNDRAALVEGLIARENKRGHSEFSGVTTRDVWEETSMCIYILP